VLSMGKTKGKGIGKGGGGGDGDGVRTAPPADNSAAVADAAKRRKKGKSQSGPMPGGLVGGMAVLLVAIVATVLFTRSPPPKAPVDPKAPVWNDPAFKPQGRAAQCESWATDGECENNAEFMAERCPQTCAKRPQPPPRKDKKPKEASKKKKSGPQDKDPNCGTWATSGECERNPEYMLAECPAACSGESSEAEEVDIHQDCNAWVSDGECYRNPAFMLQQCKASCSKFNSDNAGNILMDTSDTCVNFALRGGCESDEKKASSICRASCHIQRICANHTETTTCSRALRCEAIGDHLSDCAERAAAGQCHSDPMRMLKKCLKSCSERDLEGMMRFHLPHSRTTLSPLIDLPGAPPRLASFYGTPPQATNADAQSKAICPRADEVSKALKLGGHVSFATRVGRAAEAARIRQKWSRYHWGRWDWRAGRERTPRVPHLFSKVAREAGDASAGHVTVQHVSFSPRIRYLHRLLSAEECDHVLKVSEPLFSRSPVRGSVTRVRTSTTAMLGGRHDDAIVKRIRNRIARFSGYPVDLLEPLQVVRYERGQKYEGHHDFFDVCDLEDKSANGRRQVTFLIYLVDMPEGETGGGTRFPDLQLEVAPEKGSAIVFNDCLDWGGEDGRSLHAGQPPLNPATVKYAINGWIRSQPVYSRMGGNSMGSLF